MATLVVICCLALGACEADRVDAERRKEIELYLLKICVEKGGFPEVDGLQHFKSCKFPEAKK